jgi:hypothetical protein
MGRAFLAPPDVWLGTTTESEPYYRERWPILAAIPAAVHDSGKRRSMLRDTLCVQVLLKPYGKERGHDTKEGLAV